MYTAADDWRLPGPGDVWQPPEHEEAPDVDIYSTERRDGRRQDTCICQAYRFPHRRGGGHCQVAVEIGIVKHSDSQEVHRVRSPCR